MTEDRKHNGRPIGSVDAMASSVEPVAVPSQQDRAARSLADGKIDRPSRPGGQRDHGRPAALSHDPQRAVAPLESEQTVDRRRSIVAGARPLLSIDRTWSSIWGRHGHAMLPLPVAGLPAHR